MNEIKKSCNHYIDIKGHATILIGIFVLLIYTITLFPMLVTTSSLIKDKPKGQA